MGHVFISYARPDEPLAQLIAEELRGAGFEVWRDDELPAHRAYAEVIEERINGAQAVVVLWSGEAARSHWVRAEADTAREARKLVQASLDGSLPPMPFNQIQCADLKGWDGQSSAPGWRKLLGSVTELAGKPAADNQRVKSRDVSICILPFQNMSGDSEQEYFSDGICEDITTDLSKVSALEVIARNTAFTFKGQSVNVCEVARKLGVTHVLEGSVRKVADRVRINAQLIDGASGGHIWAERFDRDLTDIFTIQDEISNAIVAALKLKLLPEEKKAIEQRRTSSVEAYNFYLLARQYWVTGNHGDPRREERVMRISSRAVEIDPYYADSWALLSIAQSNLRYGFGYEVDICRRAIAPVELQSHVQIPAAFEGQFGESICAQVPADYRNRPRDIASVEHFEVRVERAFGRRQPERRSEVTPFGGEVQLDHRAGRQSAGAPPREGGSKKSWLVDRQTRTQLPVTADVEGAANHVEGVAVHEATQR